ncbi:MAG: DUF4251 domain-containing protein [Niabella sp.]
MKPSLYKWPLLLLMVYLTSACSTSKSAFSPITNYDSLINEKRYTFVAQNVTPTEDARFNARLMFSQGNSLYQLTSRYDIKITPDSVIVFLPFFGRAFTAPIDPTKGGIQFTSTKFGYQQSIRKKNYQITVTPQDFQEVRNIFLTISPSGYASVQVLSLNRTPISFNGIIEPNK